MKADKTKWVTKTTTSRKEYKIASNPEMEDPYWDEGVHFYPFMRWGYKNPNRRLMSFQVRMYRTWKHNRKTQWKE